ncbi:MAG TPA: hypothetical protein VMU39_07235 [Solirubrobacteraceae bacterium]|nr:hypothetical protein [Solirubrobacteraceae bacterium]
MHGRLLRAVSLATLMAAFATPAQASVAANWTVLSFSAGRSGAPLGGLGQRSAAPTSQALAATVGQMTGLAPSQVTTVDACGAARPGHVRCDAQVMILRSTRALVRPHLGASTRRRPQTALPNAVQDTSGVTPAATLATAPPQAGTPAYIQQAYDMSYLSQTQGAANTVAVIAAYDDPTAESDLATYRSTYGLGACTTANGCFKKVNQAGAATPLPAGDTAWQMEISLDLDAVSALCPRCTIVLVEANTTAWSDIQTAAGTGAAMGANEISLSFSSAAATPPAAGFTFPGVATVASTGDSGYAGVGQDNYPAAFAGVTAAGGTRLTPMSGATGARGFAESAWSVDRNGMSAGSGCDVSLSKPPYQTDNGCTGRAYADVSADADPSTGLVVYDSGKNGWIVAGGTSLSAPLIAAYYATTGLSATTPQWAYADSALLNDPVSGSNGTCGTTIAYICTARAGYDGPTGVGSISGAVADGAPGIGGPSVGTGTGNTYAQSITFQATTLLGGVYPNGADTTYWWEYGPTTAYGQQTTPTDIGSGRVPVTVTDTLTGLAPRTVYHYRLVAQNALGTSYGYDYALTSAVPPPANTSPPTISGTVRQGQLLNAATGSWTPAQTAFCYQWQRDTGSGFTDVTGATNYNYVLGSADLGANMRVVVTASNGSGTATATSATVGPVLSGGPVNTALPSISGTPQRLATLTLSGGTWNPAPTVYGIQWQRDTGSGFADIGGAVGSSYVPVKADEGAMLRVVLTGRNAFGSASATSAAVGPVIANAPATGATPTIAGTAKRGYALTVYPGTWLPSDDVFTYQWQRCDTGGANCVAIAGATAQVYTVALADESTTLRAVVAATNTDGTLSRSSAPTATIAPAPPSNVSAPWLTGDPRVGATLTTTPGTWTPTDSVVSYQWQRSSAAGYQDIAGATARSYVLTNADVGNTVRVVVTATNIDGTQSLMPPASLTVGQPPVNLTAPAAPTGTLMDTYALTADNGTWDSTLYTGSGPSTVSYGYQWLRCPASATVPTGCATMTTSGSSYRLGVGDIGARIAVKVTASTAGGSTSAVSALTGVISAKPLTNLTPPAIQGLAQIPQQLTATTGTWSGPVTTVAFVWSRCDASGANCAAVMTGQRYPLSPADKGSTLMVTATATGPGTSATASSAAVTVIDQPLPHETTAPAITGIAQRLNWLHLNAGNWTDSPTLSYQWLRCDAAGANCQPIGGATGVFYFAVAADVGHVLVAHLTAANSSGTAQATAPGTPVIAANPPVLGSPPVVVGVAREGRWIGYNGITWTKITPDTTMAAQWSRCQADGTGCQPIPGANAGIYLLTAADAGSTLMVRVTATNPDAAVAADSKTSAVVLPAPPTVSTLPLVGKDAGNVGDVLTVTPATWVGLVSTTADQFERCTTACVPVGPAGASSYTITAADIGAVMRATETASNAGGSTVAWSSSYVGPVRSVASGSAVLAAGAAVMVRNVRGAAIAFASLSEPRAATAVAASAARTTARATLTLRRAPGVRGRLRAWACPANGQGGAPPPPCTRAVSVGSTVIVPLTGAVARGKVRIVVVRRPR